MFNDTLMVLPYLKQTGTKNRNYVANGQYSPCSLVINLDNFEDEINVHSMYCAST